MVLNGNTTTRFVSSVTGLAKGCVCSVVFVAFVPAWPSGVVVSPPLPPRKNSPAASTATPPTAAAILPQAAPSLFGAWLGTAWLAPWLVRLGAPAAAVLKRAGRRTLPQGEAGSAAAGGDPVLGLGLGLHGWG